MREFKIISSCNKQVKSREDISQEKIYRIFHAKYVWQMINSQLDIIPVHLQRQIHLWSSTFPEIPLRREFPVHPHGLIKEPE